MSNWTATNELRFVERCIKGELSHFYYGEPYYHTNIVRILQQKWHLSEYIEGEGWKYSKTEWRDVPVVEEE